MKQLVLWDIDRTLVRCGPAARRAIERAARRALDGRVDWSEDTIPLVEMSGGTDPAILLELWACASLDDGQCRELLDVALGHLVEEMEAAAGQFPVDGHRLAGVPEVLARLDESGDVLQTILTGNTRSNAVIKLRAFGLDPWFDLDIGAFGSDHADRNRLGPLALERATAKHEVTFDSADVWIVGDTPKDLGCAMAIGARCLLVATGTYTVDDLADLGADEVLADLADVDRVVDLVLGSTGGGGR
ncbi:MAG: HAD family hydrolase [Acidimicrobiales bacterium]